jgi:hypothetical protein
VRMHRTINNRSKVILLCSSWCSRLIHDIIEPPEHVLYRTYLLPSPRRLLLRNRRIIYALSLGLLSIAVLLDRLKSLLYAVALHSDGDIIVQRSTASFFRLADQVQDTLCHTLLNMVD